MKYKLACACIILLIAGAVQANVNLEWRTSQQTAGVGDTVTLGLYAVPDNAQQHLISAMSVLVTWDPSYLSFQSLGDPQPLWVSDGFFADLDGINDNRSDGDLLYSAMGYLGEPVVIEPQGAFCVDFIFRALAPTSQTSVSIVPTMGYWGQTRVYDSTVPNLDVKGTIGSAGITVVPEPSGLLACFVGVVPFIRRRAGMC